MSLLGFAAAGAMEGIGKGMIENAKAVRDERMKEIERQHQLQRDEASRAHAKSMQDDSQAHSSGLQQAGQRHAEGMQERSQGFQSTEAEKTRAHSASEGDKTRTSQAERTLDSEGEYRTDEEGNTYRVRDDKAKPVTTEDGKPVTGLRRTPKDGDAVTATTIANAKRDASKEVLKGMREQGVSDVGAEIESWRRRLIGQGIPTSDADAWAAEERGAHKIPDKPAGSSSSQPGKKGPTWSLNPANWDWKGSEGAAAAPAPAAAKPPANHPNAKWSERANGWVVQKDGKWFKVTE